MNPLVVKRLRPILSRSIWQLTCLFFPKYPKIEYARDGAATTSSDGVDNDVPNNNAEQGDIYHIYESAVTDWIIV